MRLRHALLLLTVNLLLASTVTNAQQEPPRIITADQLDDIHPAVGAPLVVTGGNATLLLEAVNITLEGPQTGETLAAGVMILDAGTRNVTNTLIVQASAGGEFSPDQLTEWSGYTAPVTNGYELQGAWTVIDLHRPFGSSTVTVEVVKLLDDGSALNDWYDVTVTHRVVPGRQTGWRLDWAGYTMNGSAPESNVELSSYSSPATAEEPTGLFTFLWRLLRFNLRRLIPWNLTPPPKVHVTDNSSYTEEVFSIEYRLDNEPPEAREGFTERYSYVLRVPEGVKPVFWHADQAKYVKGMIGEKYITPHGGGYIRVR